ncbi:MAG: hypothetical protein QOG63_2376, partial [Thermoleophilaceae bacterium]|nr:hypothetical protein [Thermoleophilaceae bacterium]
MRSFGLVIGVAVALAVVPAAATAKIAPANACAQRGEKIEANASARVFSYYKGAHPRVYGCVYGQKPRFLGRYNLHPTPVPNATMLLDGLVLHGRLATISKEACGPTTGGGCTERVKTIDLGSGAITRAAHGFGGRPNVVTAPDGSFAFGLLRGRGGEAIVGAGPHGARVLDQAATGIDIWSLKLGANLTATWH